MIKAYTAVCLFLLTVISGCALPVTIDLPADSIDARMTAGNYVKSGDYLRAGLVLQNLAERDDRSPLDFLHGGAYLEMAGKPSAAAELYRRGIDLLAEDPPMSLLSAHRLALLTLEMERNLNSALAVLERDDAGAAQLDLRAAYALKRKDPDQALRLLNEGINRYPGDPVISWLYLHKAEITFARYLPSETHEALYHAINHAENHPLLIDLITRLWEDSKEFAEGLNVRSIKE